MNNKNIKLHTVGQIIEGESAGWYLYIKEDAENTGGYLLLLSPEPAFSILHEGYNNWVESFDDLAKFFNEAGWKIDWLENNDEGQT